MPGAGQGSPELPVARFAAFSFVDRITLIDGLSRVEGVYTIPPGVSFFPVSLVAEAIGQLAAWVAMSHVAFAKRPVAALAGQTRIYSLVQPGDALTLQVDIESCDEDAIVYSGRASVNGKLVLELLDTIGSMLDTAEFDEPARLAEDFAVLTGSGRPPGLFPGVPQPALTTLAHEAGRSLTAQLDVPSDGSYFADHFPLRPVFPATLMLDAQLRLAQQIASEAAGAAVRVTRITNVKVRAFTSPGATLELFAEHSPDSDADGQLLIKVGARVDARTIAGAKMYFATDSGESQ